VQLIRDDPFSDEAQALLAEILRATEGFEQLKTNLAEEGQRDHGIMTSAGVLVNANTRAVALRDIGTAHINVLVLPEDANHQEIDELELRLQMQQDLRQEYTFTNELLFVEDLVATYGFSAEDVAKALRWATSSDPAELRKGRQRVEQSTRMLSIIRDIQATSGGALPLTFFDDKRQSVIEIDQQYQRMRGRNPRRALAVRNARTLGLLTDRLGYQPLRLIDETFTALKENDLLRDVVPALAEPAKDDEPSGLDVLGGEDGGDGEIFDVGGLATALAQSSGEDTVSLPSQEKRKTVDREQALDAVADAIQSAVEEARLDARRGNRLDAPRALIAEADGKLKRAIEAYDKSKDEAGFDRDAFLDEFGRIRRRVQAFAERE
jgi:hypothetical protein